MDLLTEAKVSFQQCNATVKGRFMILKCATLLQGERERERKREREKW